MALADFASPIPTDRVTHEHKNGVWHYAEPTTRTTYDIAEVQKGFMANENLLIRTQYLDQDGHPIVLSREASIEKLMNDGKFVVE